MTLFHAMFDTTAARHAERDALVHGARRITYAGLKADSEKLAAAFAARGVARGDRIVVYLHNRPEVVEVALAASRLGAIFVPANPLLRSRQLQHVVEDSGARLLVTARDALPGLSDLIARHPALDVVVCDADESVPHASYAEVLAKSAGASLPAVPTNETDPVAILYTSGSTGRPKGVVLSHRNLVSGAHCIASYLQNVPEDRLLAALPLSFDYGFSQVSTAFAVGACAVTVQYSTAASLVHDVETQRITGLAGVPTMWAHLADAAWPAEAVRTLRYLTNSGGVFQQPVIAKLQKRLPDTQIFCMYGLTEAFRSTYLDPAELANRPGSIGKAIPTQEVLVLRPDGTRCAPGETGELVHRGSLVTLGYWNDPELTRTRFRPLPGSGEIAVFSGDRVRADADGFLFFVGRDDGLIKVSGNRVSPNEIEEVLLEVPGVTEGIAVGVADEVLGQRIVVGLVTGSRDKAAVVEATRQATRIALPSYMAPAQACVLDAIPRNPNGKQDRAAVLADFEARLARSDASMIDLRNPR
jgi:acyl-CoA ligase (AMP-forming) (exosortase A-associated)